jgi:hypothetical protein
MNKIFSISIVDSAKKQQTITWQKKPAKDQFRQDNK